MVVSHLTRTVTVRDLRNRFPELRTQVEMNRYLEKTDVLWRATLQRAGEMSRNGTADLGCRALDVLHVAAALELGLRQFVTFDRRQQQLAGRAGLKLVRVP